MALMRRQIWTDDPQRLLSVAVELADLSSAVRASTRHVELEQVVHKIDSEVMATLKQVREVDQAHQLDFAQDKRFAYYRTNQQFKTLLAGSQDKSVKDSAVQPAVHNVPAEN